ncbi:MAG: hypothetical protein JXA23_04245 [Bacteroidales bacterium]|nr:hypothetical protein [Bacteroidales bacterium]
MKTKIIPITCMLLLSFSFITGSYVFAGKKSTAPQGTVNIYTTSDVYDLTTKWVNEYKIANPHQNIQVSILNDPAEVDQVQSGENLCFTSSGKLPAGKQGSLFQVVVGREIIVPVISSENPFLNEINHQGISRDALTRSIQSPGPMTWGMLLKQNITTPVRYFILNDDIVQSVVEGFIGTGTQEKDRITLLNSEELIQTLKQDPYAIAFCRLSDIVGPSSSEFTESVRLMPIDKNENGKMEYMEQIYGNVPDFTRGVWIGKYPKELIHNLYCFSDARPQNEANLVFLQWVLTSGQEYLPQTGFSVMAKNDQQSQLNKLNPIEITPVAVAKTSPTRTLLLIILLGLVVLGMLVPLFIRVIKKRHATARAEAGGAAGQFDEKSVMAPGGLYFDKTHTWAFMEQDGVVKIGIDDFLQHVIGPVTRIELKKPGDRINKGDSLCTLIQKGKQLNIYAPVSGRIKGQNERLLADLSTINQYPYTDGWIYSIEPENWVREITFLFMAEKYNAWIKEEFARLKDFLATLVARHASFSSSVVLQEGGQLRDHVLTDLDPEIWEDFQIKFINSPR